MSRKRCFNESQAWKLTHEPDEHSDIRYYYQPHTSNAHIQFQQCSLLSSLRGHAVFESPQHYTERWYVFSFPCNSESTNDTFGLSKGKSFDFTKDKSWNVHETVLVFPQPSQALSTSHRILESPLDCDFLSIIRAPEGHRDLCGGVSLLPEISGRDKDSFCGSCWHKNVSPSDT